MSRPVHRVAAALATSAVALALAAPPAHAERVGIRFDDMTVDFGNLHLTANLLGYDLSTISGPVSELMVAWELNESLMLRAQAVFPMLGFLGAGESPVRIEAGFSFHGTSVALEHESVTVESHREGDMIHSKSVKLPVFNRNSVGVGGGLLFRENGLETEVEGRTRETRGTHLTVYVGLSTMNAAGYTANIEGYGDFFNYRWLNAGLDLLVDLVQAYDLEPDDAPSRFGGRLWAETIFGQTIGVSGRLEIGIMPGDVGFYLMATLGVGLNLDV